MDIICYINLIEEKFVSYPIIFPTRIPCQQTIRPRHRLKSKFVLYRLGIEKLLFRRENFDSWNFAEQTYLEHEKLWNCCVQDDETDAKRVTNAKVKLLIELIIYVHVQKLDRG